MLVLSVGESRGSAIGCSYQEQPRFREPVIPHVFDDPDEAPYGFVSPGITSVWYRTVAGGDNPLTVRIKMLAERK